MLVAGLIIHLTPVLALSFRLLLQWLSVVYQYWWYWNSNRNRFGSPLLGCVAAALPAWHSWFLLETQSMEQ